MENQADPSIYNNRLSRLANGLSVSKLDALILNPGPSLTYLTGLHFHLSERPVIVIFVPHTPPAIILPELETAKTRQLPFAVQVFPYPEDPSRWLSVFQQAFQATNLNRKCLIGVEPRRLRVLELRVVEAATPQASFLSGEENLAELRLRKEPIEIDAMAKAVAIAQEALKATLPAIKPGVSEREIAAELMLQLLRGGSDPEFPFMPIVASGPNSANPHASPTDRTLQSGDMLVIDWGAKFQEYVSDITRTFAIGKPNPEMERIYTTVAEANQAGRAAAGPGIPASQVDRAAREVIEKAGYGPYFTHRTGHGIGREGHEDPYIRGDNEQRLIPGMTFTVEPGIYLPGQNGVRIEDNILITEDSAKSLTDFPRELHIID